MDTEDPDTWKLVSLIGGGVFVLGILLFLFAITVNDADPFFYGGIIVIALGLGVMGGGQAGVGAARNKIVDDMYDQPPAVKIRCRSCRALNEETNRFCGRCGKPL